jgi:LacI family transcriptional regulator
MGRGRFALPGARHETIMQGDRTFCRPLSASRLRKALPVPLLWQLFTPFIQGVGFVARPTINDIASACGVSLTTVSLVLNNNPRISQKTRTKVLEAVEKFGYQPNAFARSLASKTSHALSVVVPHLNHVFADIYFGEIVSGIYECACDLGYKVLLDVADQRFLASKEYLKLLKSRRVDGMLYIGSSVYDEFLFELETSPYPMMLVNHYFPGRKLNFIAADYAATGRIAAQHLLDFGHRFIGVLAGTNTHTARDFQKHFTETCARTGAKSGSILWADGWFTEQGGYEGAQWLLQRKPELTAVMAGNDKMAIGAIRYLREIGRRIPDDISVMGVDDIPSAAFSVPGLTTVRHELYQIGRLAVEGILSVVKKQSATSQQVLPAKLVIRESTGPVRR